MPREIQRRRATSLSCSSFQNDTPRCTATCNSRSVMTFKIAPWDRILRYHQDATEHLRHVAHNIEHDSNLGACPNLKFEALKGHLYATARQLNVMHDELARFKKAAGLDKPFPLLKLPREIRDDIYAYSLCATLAVQPHELPDFFSALVDPNCPYRPPTPGLLRANKQIYQESVDVLYSRNIFRFWEPVKLHAFGEQIGSENRARVRQLWLHHLSKDDSGSGPSTTNWIAALKTCPFEDVMHLTIEGRPTYTSPTSWFPAISEELQDFILDFFRSLPKDKVPRLSLKKIREEERDKFPTSWKVVTDPLENHQEEIMTHFRRLEEEEDLYD
jgi:hypothetical protein